MTTSCYNETKPEKNSKRFSKYTSYQDVQSRMTQNREVAQHFRARGHQDTTTLQTYVPFIYAKNDAWEEHSFTAEGVLSGIYEGCIPRWAVRPVRGHRPSTFPVPICPISTSASHCQSKFPSTHITLGPAAPWPLQNQFNTSGRSGTLQSGSERCCRTAKW